MGYSSRNSVEQRHDFDFDAHPVEVVGKKERFRRNMEAIKVLKKCEADNRFAIPDEQIVLSKYVGWGGIPEAFDENNSSWANEYKELVEVLSPDEYAHARESTLTAFYTPQEVVKACYDIAENLGFKQGNILEPSCGIGNFIGMKPKSMVDSKVYGIDLILFRQLLHNSFIKLQVLLITDMKRWIYPITSMTLSLLMYLLAILKYRIRNTISTTRLFTITSL